MANVARTCETPFVIGLFGKWGTGKTIGDNRGPQGC
ncbi:MAG: hypothetical protein EXQ56_00430 [Acidobacteria bacterium]|nr:hypothetical protein [Acidobacteriota bacterium]